MKLCTLTASVASFVMEGIERVGISWIWTESSVRLNQLGTDNLNSHQVKQRLW